MKKVKITIYGHILNGKKEFIVEVANNAKVRHCFYRLFEKYPEIEDKIFTKSGSLKEDLRMLINGRPLEDLNVDVSDGSEICVFPVSAGG